MRLLVTIWLAAWAAVAGTARGQAQQACNSSPAGRPALYGYNIIEEHPHDPKAFTQGLVYERRCDTTVAGRSCGDVLYESTGMYGESEIRIVDLPTGAVRARRRLGSQWFGEGLVKVNDTLHQLTWRGPTGFSWSAQTLAPAGSFRTPLRDGWGAALDGRLVVLSDGSSTLTWVDPARGWAKVKSLPVMVGSRPVTNLNELEVIDGQVWANIWYTDCLARICPATGQVTGWLLMQGLRQGLEARGLPNGGKSMDVLNGIAWDAARRRLFVTGKYWPRLFEVSLKPLDAASPTNQQMAASCLEAAYGR